MDFLQTSAKSGYFPSVCYFVTESLKSLTEILFNLYAIILEQSVDINGFEISNNNLYSVTE